MRCTKMSLFPKHFSLPVLSFITLRSHPKQGFHYLGNCCTNEKLVYLGGVIRCVIKHQLGPWRFNLALGCSQKECSHVYSRLGTAFMKDTLHNLPQDRGG